MQVYEGIVKDRVVLLPENVHLDEGQRVEVRIREAGQKSSEELFKIRLVEVGLLEEFRRPSLPLADQDRTPIRVKGKPLSEQIMEERR
jgi:predicted DNA-binding antitoxin AbrB/MazE fold protein